MGKVFHLRAVTRLTLKWSASRQCIHKTVSKILFSLRVDRLTRKQDSHQLPVSTMNDHLCCIGLGKTHGYYAVNLYQIEGGRIVL